MQDHWDLMNDFDCAAKTKQAAWKPSAFGPNMKKYLKIFKNILKFFDQNLDGKKTFFTFLLNISGISET